ncbi:MAG: A/G-specific adenine glycosylase, partial [Chthoniobacteraceae bacterium]
MNPQSLRRSLTAWFQREARDLPWRRTRDPYAILVSEIMLQQTQVATVIPFYARWLARFPDFATLAAAEESD